MALLCMMDCNRIAGKGEGVEKESMVHAVHFGYDIAGHRMAWHGTG